VLVERFPYADFYRVMPKAIVVVGVIHGHRHPDEWKTSSINDAHGRMDVDEHYLRLEARPDRCAPAELLDARRGPPPARPRDAVLPARQQRGR
jgi:hypothetical protein